MNPMNKKTLILSISVIFAVLLLGGWLLLREPHSAPESQNTPVARENPPQSGEGNTSKNPPIPKISKSPEMLRDEKLVSILAQENGEPESGVRLSFGEVAEHHVEGLAVLESDPRKKISFFATNVLPISNQQEDRKTKYGTWTIIDRDFATCKLMGEYSFPEKMLVKCIGRESGNFGVSGLWRRVSGDPKEDCSDHVYEGGVAVRGWYEWRMNYVERDWMLVVDKSDESKLITGFPRALSFKLRSVPPELEESLKNAMPNNPVSLTVKKIGYSCEGSPWLEL